MSTLGAFILLAFGFRFFVFFELWFYPTWNNNKLAEPKAMWYIFISSISLNVLINKAKIVFREINKPPKMESYILIGTVVYVGLSCLSPIQFRLTSVIMDAISFSFILAGIVMPKACKLMRISLNELCNHNVKDVQILVTQT